MENISNKKTLEESKKISNQIENLEVELKKTLNKLKKQSQFNNKMELNIKATEISKKMNH